jgi:hypothetical protein
MEIVTGDQAPTLERTEGLRLLQEMAAVVRTIFAVDAVQQTGQQETPQEIHPTTAGAGGAPVSGGAAPAPAVVPPAPVAAPASAAAPPTSIPVPAVAILQEIAFLDD